MSDPSQRLQDALAGRYRIQRELGQGGMATVFLAEDLKHHRQVAIKVLDPEVAAAIGPERFLREIEIAARLEHPHILPLFDSGQADGLLFYVMPYVAGESLRDRLAHQRQLPVDEVLRIATELADALGHAHTQGILHRDVKPENVLFSGGHALLADFGIARALGAAGPERLTQTGVTVGTPAYMSPEQAAGQARLDAASDQYGLGCVVYEMLAGQPPFTGPSAESIAHQHLSVPPHPVTELRPTVTRAMSAAIGKALAKSPADRYANMGAFATALTEGAAQAEAPLPARRRPAAYVAAAAALVVILALGAYAALRSLQEGRGGIESMAVLPLENLSRDASQDYFVDGMTEELINQVAQAGAVRVISRMSVMSLRGARLTAPEVGRKLGVDAIVVGTVRRTGDEVKVTAELIRTRPERQLWARSYSRKAGDLPGLQGEIAGAIVQELRLKLPPERHARVTTARAVSPEAYEAYQKGRFFLNKQDEQDFRTALEYFQRSVRIDPLYPQGWAGVGDAYYNLSNVYLAPRVAIPQARAAVERALQLDPALPEAHASLGILRTVYDWDWPGAESEYRRALELNPSLSQGHFYYGYLLAVTGRFDESIREYRQAMRLDPLSTYVRVFGAWPYYLAGRYDEAIAAWRAAEEVEPNYAPTHFNLGQAYEQKGMFSEAVEELEKGTALADNPAPLALLCHAYARAGRRGDALATLRRIQQLMVARHISANTMAIAYAGLGDKEQAFRWLEKAYANRDEDLVFLKTDPKFDVLRTDPRFRGLVRRLRLEG